MKTTSDPGHDVAVIGAGIVGLAIAYTAARRGLKVAVFERTPAASGASIRNFGLIWPVGQAPGPMLERALRAREVWQQLAKEAGVWIMPNGSLTLAQQPDEMAVLEEFRTTTPGAGYDCSIISAEEAVALSPAVKRRNLRGALYSRTELTVSPRQALPAIAAHLAEKWGVTFYWNTAITQVESGRLSSFEHTWRAERIFVCSGADFEVLYPREFREAGLVKCKLQMLRTAAQPGGWQLGPSLCAGLTLRHYANFEHCPSLQAVSDRYDRENPDFKKWGIHVLLSQNHLGELIIGDSHEYGTQVSPFDNEDINQLILHYLHRFADVPDFEIAETWHGVYPKLAGRTDFVLEPAAGITIVNGLGGAGMTLSFGLAQEILAG